MIHPELEKRIDALIIRMKELGHNIIVTSGYRSIKKQDLSLGQ